MGVAALPDVGPAHTAFADWVAKVPAKVPDVVTGDPDTEKMAGRVRATLETVPVPVLERVPPEKPSPVPMVTLVQVFAALR